MLKRDNLDIITVAKTIVPQVIAWQTRSTLDSSKRHLLPVSQVELLLSLQSLFRYMSVSQECDIFK